MPRAIADTRWVLTLNMAEGGNAVEARVVANGYSETERENGLVGAFGRVGARSPHLLVMSPGELKNGNCGASK